MRKQKSSKQIEIILQGHEIIFIFEKYLPYVRDMYDIYYDEVLK